MTPRVDDVIYLSDDRKTVTVTGPIGPWAGDEAAAVFSVVISQPTGNGAGPTTAIGASTVTYEPGAGAWTAQARVTGNGMQFHQGPATSRAWATIAKPGGGAESYKWTDTPQLDRP
jgi:hypothetical protein